MTTNDLRDFVGILQGLLGFRWRRCKVDILNPCLIIKVKIYYYSIDNGCMGSIANTRVLESDDIEEKL